MKVEHFGTPGHFCGGRSCIFHLHTHVGDKCISTVGEYYPRGLERKNNGKWEQCEPETIGLYRLYETMVFTLNEDGDHSGMNEDFAAYNDRDDANRGHAEMVKKYKRELEGRDVRLPDWRAGVVQRINVRGLMASNSLSSCTYTPCQVTEEDMRATDWQVVP